MRRLTAKDERSGHAMYVRQCGPEERLVSTNFIKMSEMQDVLDLLDAYEELKEDGRLIDLPCKVGQYLFFVDWNAHENAQPVPVRVQGISVAANHKDVVLHFGGFPFVNAMGSDIGKILFLSEREARAAIEHKFEGGEGRDGQGTP